LGPAWARGVRPVAPVLPVLGGAAPGSAGGFPEDGPFAGGAGMRDVPPLFAGT
jgi:hypothetical protein